MIRLTASLLGALVLVSACGSDGGGGGGSGGSDAGPDSGLDATVDGPGDADAAVEAGPPPDDCGSVTLKPIATGLQESIFATAPAGAGSRLFVIEEVGRVRLIDGDQLVTTPFLDLTSTAQPGQEKGLLGLAFHPSYQQNGRLWVLYVDTKSDVVIAEHARSASDPNLAEPTLKKELLRFTPTPGNHLAGQLAFGPDGYLYVGIGDGNGAQKLASKHGKILRLDVDKHPTPPPGNMTGAGVDPTLWSYGFHNPWRFSFDRATGELYIGDVGLIPPREEINVEPPGAGGRNYGYDVMSGNDCVNAGCDPTGITLPIKVYDHGAGDCAIMGGYVYRGSAVSCLTGKYLYADLCTRRVWTLAQSGGKIVHEQELTASALDPTSVPDSPVSFGEDASGELYLVTLSGTVSRFAK